MRKLLITAVLAVLVSAEVYADGDKAERVNRFITYYHRQPAPDRVPEMLGLLLKEKLLAQPPLTDAVARRLCAEAFGHMARGNGKLIRLYETQFAHADATGRAFLLDALQVCGDEATLRGMTQWLADPRYADAKERLEATRRILADPKRALPRDRPARVPTDLDLLWADFLITGEYPPVSRILDTLDLDSVRREAVDTWLKQHPDQRQGYLETLQMLGLLEPGTKDKLASGDLDSLLLHDKRGRLKPHAIEGAGWLDEELGLPDKTAKGGLALKAVASWSLQGNLQQHPRLAEVLKANYRNRPAKSQELVKKWLRLDEYKVALDKKSQQLQGTWQAIDWQEDGDGETPKARAERLKYIRWTFGDDEVRITKPFSINNVVQGQGGTIVATYRIDASRSPKVIVSTTAGSEEGTFIRSIYTIEGDVLKVCGNKDGGAAPTDFSVKRGSGRVLITLKRVKQ